MNRDKQIDTARGIAILLVIVGHCCGNLDFYLNKIILSFHMPLFFFLSGMTAKPYRGGYSQYIKKARSLLIPQATLLVVQYIVTAVDNLSDGGSMPNLINFIFGYWFLPVLFLVSILYLALTMTLDLTNPKALIGTVVVDIFAIIAALLFKQNGIEITYISTVPMAFFFYICGHVSYSRREKIKSIKEKLGFRNSYINGFIGTILVIVFFCTVDLNSPVAMYENEYGNLLLFAITAFLGIASVWLIAGKLRNLAYLVWCGRNSIVIYVWQFAVCKICRAVMMRLTLIILPGRSELVWFLTTAMLAMLCVVPIVLVSNRFIPYAYGKSNFPRKRVDRNE